MSRALSPAELPSHLQNYCFINKAIVQKIQLPSRNEVIINLRNLNEDKPQNKKLYITQGILNQVIEQETLKYKELNRNKDLEIIYEGIKNSFPTKNKYK